MSRLPIFYDPLSAPGTTGPGPDGTPVQFVSPQEYYVRMLGQRMNVTLVFLSANMPERVPAADLPAVDDAIAEAYWNAHGGCLTPPRVRRLVRAASDGHEGEGWLAQTDQVREAILVAETLEDAVELHGIFRVEWLWNGVGRRMSDLQVSAGELMTDYVLLQRAIMEDVRTAEARREPGETRASVLERMDRGAELAFERAITTVHKPQLIADAIPAAQRVDIERYARSRESLASAGLFARLDSLGL